jgi:hypothetical protein
MLSVRGLRGRYGRCSYPWWRGRPTMEAMKQLANDLEKHQSPEDGALMWPQLVARRELGTYGRLLGAHRHRRNRPCTYPNYQLSAQVHHVAVPRALLQRTRGVFARSSGGDADKPLHSRDGGCSDSAVYSPIVDNESCDFLCRGRWRLAELIEIDTVTVDDGEGRERRGQLLTLHVD